MDLSKAFNCLQQNLLAAKLSAYGMCPDAIRLLLNYLRSRKQRVKFVENTGEWMKTPKEVPQGSILGPSLFNLFWNDIIFALKHRYPVNYADDNTLCAISDFLRDTIQKFVADGNIAIDWFTNNDMMATPSKFQFMTTGNSNVILTLRSVTIEQDNYVKHLGVNIDKKLDFKFHINEVIRKCAHQLNALLRQSRVLNVLAKKKVFNVFNWANLNYCTLVWINRNKTDLARLQKVQERAVRLIFNDKMSTYIGLLQRVGVPSVLIRWQWVLATEVYKALHGLSPLYIQNLFNEKKLLYNLRARKSSYNQNVIQQPMV